MCDSLTVFINCPYYSSRSGNKIICEGIHHAKQTSIIFENYGSCYEHLRKYCANSENPNHFRRCGIAAQLEIDYGMV